MPGNNDEYHEFHEIFFSEFNKSRLKSSLVSFLSDICITLVMFIELRPLH